MKLVPLFDKVREFDSYIVPKSPQALKSLYFFVKFFENSTSYIRLYMV